MLSVLHAALLLRDQRRAVDRRRLPPDAGEGVVCERVREMRAPDHDLGRHAADVYARAAERPRLDHGHCRALVRGT